MISALGQINYSNILSGACAIVMYTYREGGGGGVWHFSPGLPLHSQLKNHELLVLNYLSDCFTAIQYYIIKFQIDHLSKILLSNYSKTSKSCYFSTFDSRESDFWRLGN